MAFVDFSSSDLKKQGLSHDVLDIHGNDAAGDLADRNPGVTGYRIRLTFLVVTSFVLWGAVFEIARLIFRA